MDTEVSGVCPPRSATCRANSRCRRFVANAALKRLCRAPSPSGSVTPLRELHDCIAGWSCTRTGAVQQTVGGRAKRRRRRKSSKKQSRDDEETLGNAWRSQALPGASVQCHRGVWVFVLDAARASCGAFTCSVMNIFVHKCGFNNKYVRKKKKSCAKAGISRLCLSLRCDAGAAVVTNELIFAAPRQLDLINQCS